MSKKKIVPLIIIVILVIALIITFVVISNVKTKKQEEKIRKDDERDKAAIKIINNACQNLIDENGNYNTEGPETEIVCEKGFCHITYQGENYGLECSEG